MDAQNGGLGAGAYNPYGGDPFPPPLVLRTWRLYIASEHVTVKNVKLSIDVTYPRKKHVKESAA